MGVRLYGDGFPNEFAAKLAGEKALRELLDNLANEPGDINPNQPAAPSCEKCGGSTELARVVPGLGTLPELLLFRCTGCGQVTKQRGRQA
jgi:hypothetical protein